MLNLVESGSEVIPGFQMLVGGFPCQDYSGAKPLSKAGGIEGKKGVLWWEIFRLVKLRRPQFLLLENVDRLLKSPATQRGRDFAIMLTCLQSEGYSVEWRDINAADYGMPQKRRRVFVFATNMKRRWNLSNRTLRNGIMASAFPIGSVLQDSVFEIDGDAYELSSTFGKGLKTSPFMNAGVMQGGRIYTAKVTAHYDGDRMTLGDIVVSDAIHCSNG